MTNPKQRLFLLDQGKLLKAYLGLLKINKHLLTLATHEQYKCEPKKWVRIQFQKHSACEKPCLKKIKKAVIKMNTLSHSYFESSMIYSKYTKIYSVVKSTFIILALLNHKFSSIVYWKIYLEYKWIISTKCIIKEVEKCRKLEQSCKVSISLCNHCNSVDILLFFVLRNCLKLSLVFLWNCAFLPS